MLQPEFQIPPLFAYIAVFLWALSGAIVGMHKRYDLAGVFVIALLAATGGILRDLLVGDTPAVLKPGTFYVSAAFLACVLFVALVAGLGVNNSVAAWTVILLFVLIRALSLRYDWQTQPILPPG